MITQPYNLNLIPGGVPVRVPVSQYDAGSRDITFAMYHGGTAFAVPAGAVVTCDGAKPDRKGFSCLAAASGSTVTVTVTEQMTAVAGEVDCQITIRKDGNVLGSANFYLVVERAALPDAADISETEISAVVDAANLAAEAAQSAQETVDTLDGKKAALDASTAAANMANSNLTAAANAADTARTNLVTATNAGNTAKGNLETATNEANAAKAALQQPTQDAQAAKAALDTANDAAEENLSQLNNSNTMAQKVTKVSPATAGNLPALTATGELTDSGKKPGDFAPAGIGNIQTALAQTYLPDTLYGDKAHSGAWWYVSATKGTTNMPPGATWGYVMPLCLTDSASITKVIYVDGGSGATASRTFQGGSWGEWEWDNPPLAYNTEYRTTERLNGKPVYTNFMNLGTAANGKTVNYTGVVEVVRAVGRVGNHVIPYQESGKYYSARMSVDASGATLHCGDGFAGYTWYLQLWYTRN